jgi:hypothetical protein
VLLWQPRAAACLPAAGRGVKDCSIGSCGAGVIEASSHLQFQLSGVARLLLAARRQIEWPATLDGQMTGLPEFSTSQVR